MPWSIVQDMRRLAIHGLVLIALPWVVAWVWRRERQILRDGRPLAASERSMAMAAGVAHPDRIRVEVVTRVPLPGFQWMHRLAERYGYAAGHTAGMALRYGIVLRADCAHDAIMLHHECVHVSQYERLGGLGAFLHRYLFECLRDGYHASSLECEARGDAPFS